MLDDMTNIVENMNRFMETSNIKIMPKETRVHRLVILRLLYSFRASVDIAWSKENSRETDVDVGDFNQKCTEVISTLQQKITCCLHVLMVGCLKHRQHWHRS